MCQRRRSNDGKIDMIMEAEVGVMSLLEGDHEPRNTGSH